MRLSGTLLQPLRARALVVPLEVCKEQLLAASALLLALVLITLEALASSSATRLIL